MNRKSRRPTRRRAAAPRRPNNRELALLFTPLCQDCFQHIVPGIQFLYKILMNVCRSLLGGVKFMIDYICECEIVVYFHLKRRIVFIFSVLVRFRYSSASFFSYIYFISIDHILGYACLLEL